MPGILVLCDNAAPIVSERDIGSKGIAGNGGDTVFFDELFDREFGVQF